MITLAYFIKCLISMGICYGLYQLFLSRRKSFIFNRLFILLSIIGCTVAPFINLYISNPTLIESTPVQIINYFSSPTFTPIDSEITYPAIQTIDVPSTAFEWVYLIYFISFLLLCKTIRTITQLSLHARTGFLYSAEGINYIRTDFKSTPFSFFNNLFISKEELALGIPNEILEHEKCHIKHWHSLDIILVELILTIQWWNPFAHLLYRCLNEIHEYTADQYAIRRTNNAQTLVELLVSRTDSYNSKKLFQTGFAQHSTIKRVKMITQEAKNISLLKSLTLLSIIFILMASCTETLLNDSSTEEAVELSLVKDQHTQLEYIYPTSLVNEVDDPEMMLTGLPEFKSPGAELFENFVTDSKFTVLIDNKEVKAAKLNEISHGTIKAFRVYDYSHMKDHTGYEVQLFTRQGYFTMMRNSISRMKDLLNGTNKKIEIINTKEIKIKASVTPESLPKF